MRPAVLFAVALVSTVLAVAACDDGQGRGHHHRGGFDNDGDDVSGGSFDDASSTTSTSADADGGERVSATPTIGTGDTDAGDDADTGDAADDAQDN